MGHRDAPTGTGEGSPPANAAAATAEDADADDLGPKGNERIVGVSAAGGVTASTPIALRSEEIIRHPLELFVDAPGLSTAITECHVVVGVPSPTHAVRIAADQPACGVIVCEPLKHRAAELLHAAGSSRAAPRAAANLRVLHGSLADLLEILPPACLTRVTLNYPPPPRVPPPRLPKWKLRRDAERKARPPAHGEDKVNAQPAGDTKASDESPSDSAVDTATAKKRKLPEARSTLLRPSVWHAVGRVLKRGGELRVLTNQSPSVAWLRGRGASFAWLTAHPPEVVAHEGNRSAGAASATAAPPPASDSPANAPKGDGSPVLEFTFTRIAEDDLIDMAPDPDVDFVDDDERDDQRLNMKFAPKAHSQHR